MELSERETKVGLPLISVDHDVIVDDKNRSCSDILCLFLFIAFAAIFIGLLIYGLIAGDASKVFAVYNSNHVRCDTSAFPCTC